MQECRDSMVCCKEARSGNVIYKITIQTDNQAWLCVENAGLFRHMFPRLLKLPTNHSFFLFGARATGKSTLINTFIKSFPDDSVLRFDLLDPEVERKFSVSPGRLLEIVSALETKPSLVFIDEVQKAPKILDVVHKLIFEKQIYFALTGASARKLKRGEANLLAGRAFTFNLYPLSFLELGSGFSLDNALRWGTLPEISKFDSTLDKMRYLFAYVSNYIKEEIQVEQLVRNIEPFRLFLEVAAQSNTEIINYSKLAREAGIDP
jgi:uncharacterized protein